MSNPPDLVGALVAQVSDPSAPRVARPAWCHVCSKPVQYRGEVCPGCIPSARVSHRLRVLDRAAASIPKKYASARFDDPRVKIEWVARTDAVREAHEVVVRALRRVMFFGAAGSGKTTLAACIAHEVIDRALRTDATPEAWELAKGFRWFSSYALSKARVNAGLGREAPEVQEAIGATFLVVDDLGAEPKIHNSPIPEVLYARDAADDAVTIVTTGFTLAQLDERYGEGIARRLLEHAAQICPAAPTGRAAPMLPGVS